MNTIRSWSKTLRPWQERAFIAYQERSASDFLLAATPAAGKTMVALRIASQLLRSGECNKIVVVSPLIYVRDQWVKTAWDSAGISLDPVYESRGYDGVSEDQGIATTYQCVTYNADIYRELCGRNKVLVILDEIHHAGDDLSWGKQLREAFSCATRRLMLSGTPFRTDSVAIPFIKYVDNLSRPDFAYSYGDALRDGDVCRHVHFPSFEGKVAYINSKRGLQQGILNGSTGREESDRLLRLALDTDGDYLPKVLSEANDQLTYIRQTHHDAGGLVIAADQSHAQNIVELIRRITGEEAAIAISDFEDSFRTIMAFSKSSRKWIVAVKMVSEGVDIPRLRVCVYATKVTTELFFRQAVGRPLRFQSELGEIDQTAYFYIPAHRELIGYMRSIQEERDHELRELEEKGKASVQTLPLGFAQDTLVSSQAEAGMEYIGLESFNPAEMNMARQIQSGGIVNEAISLADIAKIVRWSRASTSGITEKATGIVPAADLPRATIRKELRQVVNQRAKKLAALRLEEGLFSTFGESIQRIQYDLNKLQGKTIDLATVDELNERIRIINDFINRES